MELIVIATVIFSTHLVAKYVGEKRQIGYGRTIMWSLLLSPVVGLCIALCSAKIEAAED